MSSKKLTVGSLFSGIGGFDLGLERAGMEIKWQVEVDAFCQRVLAKHWPHVTRYGDIRTCVNLPAVDLICGGFPCQPFSLAGKRRGTEDDRYLWPEMCRVIGEVKPTWVLAENVPGIIATELDTVLSDLENLGYETGALVAPACAFDAPHIRRRVWILGNSNGDRKSIMSFHEEMERMQEHANVADATSTISEREWAKSYRQSCRSANASGWLTEPAVGRVAYGIPNRVDRIRGLGNAVVPQIVEWIGRHIIEAHEQ